ncbi:MAG: ATP-binding protein [Cytophagaceae bacterium]
MLQLVIICGLPGSGKSFLAKRLAQHLHYAHFNTDVERKKLFPTQRTYSEEEKQQVYQHLLQLCRKNLTEGASVMVDGTFYKEELRRPFIHLAQTLGVLSPIIYVTANEEIIQERTEQVREDSEANFAVYLKLKPLFEAINLNYLSVTSTQDNIDTLITECTQYLHSYDAGTSTKADSK